MIFSVVPREVVDVVWDDAVKVLKPAVDTSGGKLTIDHVYSGIMSGGYVLWVVMDANRIIATLVTRVTQYPMKKVLIVEWIGGSRMDEWLPLTHDVLKDFARKNGCSRMEGYGRKGWTKPLAEHGWSVDYVAYGMEVDHG
jgi:hypothetical protein